MLAGIIAAINPNDATYVEAGLIVTGGVLAAATVISAWRWFTKGSQSA